MDKVIHHRLPQFNTLESTDHKSKPASIFANFAPRGTPKSGTNRLAVTTLQATRIIFLSYCIFHYYLIEYTYILIS